MPVKKETPLAASIIFYDRISRLLGVRVIRPADEPDPRFLMNGFFTPPLYKRYVNYNNGSTEKAVALICWFPVKLGFRSFEISDGEGKIPFICNKKLTTCVLPQDIRRPINRKRSRSFKNKLALFLARLWFVKKKYKNCWLLADRDFKADDNAEHLCRWIKNHKPEQKVFLRFPEVRRTGKG